MKKRAKTFDYILAVIFVFLVSHFQTFFFSDIVADHIVENFFFCIFLDGLAEFFLCITYSVEIIFPFIAVVFCRLLE